MSGHILSTLVGLWSVLRRFQKVLRTTLVVFLHILHKNPKMGLGPVHLVIRRLRRVERSEA